MRVHQFVHLWIDTKVIWIRRWPNFKGILKSSLKYFEVSDEDSEEAPLHDTASALESDHDAEKIFTSTSAEAAALHNKVTPNDHFLIH